MAESSLSEPAPLFRNGEITVRIDLRDINIPVAIAQSPNERRYGLMHRDSLPAGQGMIFLFETPGIRSFWMKNTRIALDMIFFDELGHFVNVIHDVAPLSLDSRRSDGPAQYVLELNAGEARKLGIGLDAQLMLPFNFETK